MAARQFGVVSRRQAIAAGFTRHGIQHALSRGRLHLLHRGVYAVGHPGIAEAGRWMAAVLAGGVRAVLSHRSAAALWRMRRDGAGIAEITVPGSRGPRAGLVLHRGRLADDEISMVEGIPVTAPARTLLDLAAVIPAQALRLAAAEAEVLRLADASSLAGTLERHPGVRGATALRAIVDGAVGPPGITRSELEHRFLRFLARRRLPLPATNVRLRAGGRWFEADCVSAEARLVVELDGAAAHHTAAAFERDRARDRALQAAGWRVVRITWRQLHEAPDQIARELRALLRAGRPSD